jgi:DNA-binding beta-propeller fold protein YncE
MSFSPVNAPPATEVRSILTGEFGFPHPTGLAYLTKKRVFLVAAAGRGRTRLLRLDPFEESLGTLTLPTINASTLSFDADGARLTAIRGRKLISVRADQLEGGKPKVQVVDIGHLGLRDPRGATFDPARGIWLVLDSGSNTIVRVSASGRQRRAPLRLDLGVNPGTLRGLARNPADDLLYVASPGKGLLYGVRASGKARKVYSVERAALKHVRDMVFAPSADPTDPPSTQHLYVADSGGASTSGRVVELSLEPAVELAQAVQGKLVRTIETGRLGLPAPDPAGATYDASRDRLMVTDSEVEEMSLYRGANLYQLTRAGGLVESGTTLKYSREPTGLALDASTRTLYISDDDKGRIFVVEPGLDGRYGTADDAVTSLSTDAIGSKDPEDVAVDPASGHLFVADGIAAEVYEIASVNGVFGDGDDVVTHFDVAQFGVRDCEGIGYDSRRRRLLLVDSREDAIFELAGPGKLARVVRLFTAHDPHRALSGVTVAPTSNPNDSPTAMSYWVTDRRLDNNAYPQENDGRIYEVPVP